jgi:hypothetical protein
MRCVRDMRDKRAELLSVNILSQMSGNMPTTPSFLSRHSHQIAGADQFRSSNQEQFVGGGRGLDLNQISRRNECEVTVRNRDR